MDDHPMFVELETRCVQSDERRQEEVMHYKNLRFRIRAFVENTLNAIGERKDDKMIELLTNLSYLSTLPLRKQVPIDVFKSMRKDNPRRRILFLACAYAKGFALITEITANDSDWSMWIESL